jgi:RHS repeat-associated protein
VAYNEINLPQQVQLLGGRGIKNIYAADGRKLKTEAKQGTEYIREGTKTYSGNLVFDINDELDYIIFPEGRILYNNNDSIFTYEYHLKDHLGSTRVAFTASPDPSQGGEPEVVQETSYYPFGAPIADLSWSPKSTNRYLREGKEYISDFDWNKYDFTGRTFDSWTLRALQVDPMAEKYYNVSPYALWLNNPLRVIDPTGMDIWEINDIGEIIKRIKDETQDAFYMVAKDADGNYQRTYTTDKDGNKVYNSISFEYGAIEKQFSVNIKVGENLEKVDLFQVKGDDNATRLFEFLAIPDRTTNVEWSHAKIGNIEGIQGKNLIGTSHKQHSTVAGAAIMGYGYTMRELNHNHPNGSNTLSSADLENRDRYLKVHPNIKLNIYTTNTGYRPYTTFRDIINPIPEIKNRSLRFKN